MTGEHRTHPEFMLMLDQLQKTGLLNKKDSQQVKSFRTLPSLSAYQKARTYKLLQKYGLPS